MEPHDDQWAFLSALGRMSPAEVNRVATLYLPGEDIVRDKATGSLTGTRYYTHDGATVAMRIGDNNPRYIQADQHGTSQVTTTTPDFTTTRRTFDPYGNPIGTGQGLWPDNRGFLNMPHNPVTGLTDIGARKYDPTTGSFISVDPVLDTANPQQWNHYAYSNNNPVTYSDPTGLYCDSCNFYPDDHNNLEVGVDCPPCTSTPQKQPQSKGQKTLHEWETGTGDGSNQPIIYGHRLPTAEEMKRGPFWDAPTMMAPGESYQEAVLHWATYICDSGLDQESNFCGWAHNIGIKKANGWDALWTLAKAALLAAPAGRGVKLSPLGEKLAGSGPLPGVLEASGRIKSMEALRNYYPKNAIEYVFDPVSGTFAVGRPQSWLKLDGSPHEKLAQGIGADPSKVVGGMLWRRSDGTFVTSEFSGHYWQNWTPDVRKQFVDTMNEYGLDVVHGR
jgi:RHS repeat-associated protein